MSVSGQHSTAVTNPISGPAEEVEAHPHNEEGRKQNTSAPVLAIRADNRKGATSCLTMLHKKILLSLNQLIS
jgi:hypothetical protein